MESSLGLVGTELESLNHLTFDHYAQLTPPAQKPLPLNKAGLLANINEIAREPIYKGPPTRKFGGEFNATDLVRYAVSEARHSEQSLLPRHFAYVDYRLLGTQEQPRESHTAPVYKSLLQHGYKGPAISAFYAYDDGKLSGAPGRGFVNPTYGQLGVADGHNRLEAIRRLHTQGFLRSPIIPVQIVPAHDTDVIGRLNVIEPNSDPTPISIVEDCFSEPQRTVPSASTCFITKLRDGSWMRIREAQPDIIISRSELLADNSALRQMATSFVARTALASQN